MPGTPSTSPNLALPRYSNTDEVDFAGQVNALTDGVDAALGARTWKAPNPFGHSGPPITLSTLTVPRAGRWRLDVFMRIGMADSEDATDAVTLTFPGQPAAPELTQVFGPSIGNVNPTWSATRVVTLTAGPLNVTYAPMFAPYVKDFEITITPIAIPA